MGQALTGTLRAGSLPEEVAPRPGVVAQRVQGAVKAGFDGVQRRLQGLGDLIKAHVVHGPYATLPTSTCPRKSLSFGPIIRCTAKP